MIWFLLGLTAGVSIGSLSLQAYKKSLQITAETTQSQFIIDQWYRITKEEKAESE